MRSPETPRTFQEEAGSQEGVRSRRGMWKEGVNRKEVSAGNPGLCGHHTRQDNPCGWLGGGPISIMEAGGWRLDCSGLTGGWW